MAGVTGPQPPAAHARPRTHLSAGTRGGGCGGCGGLGRKDGGLWHHPGDIKKVGIYIGRPSATSSNTSCFWRHGSRGPPPALKGAAGGRCPQAAAPPGRAGTRGASRSGGSGVDCVWLLDHFIFVLIFFLDHFNPNCTSCAPTSPEIPEFSLDKGLGTGTVSRTGLVGISSPRRLDERPVPRPSPGGIPRPRGGDLGPVYKNCGQPAGLLLLAPLVWRSFGSHQE